MTEQELKDEFKERLNLCMRCKKMNNKQLADASGLAEDVISNYKRGTRMPNLINLSKLTYALGCTANELIPKYKPTE